MRPFSVEAYDDRIGVNVGVDAWQEVGFAVNPSKRVSPSQVEDCQPPVQRGLQAPVIRVFVSAKW